MKPSLTLTLSRRLAVAAAFGIAFTSAPAQTTLTYDTDTVAPANDGPGAWDTTTANWYNGATDQVWSNGLGDTAIFGAAAAGTGGTVTVGTVNVGTIQFNPQTTTGYTLATGTITLGTGITTTSAVASTVSAVITGANGLAFNGVLNAQNGVTLSGANTYTGITTVSTGGRLTTSNATGLGSNAGATAGALGANYTQVNANATVNVSTSTAEAFLLNGQGSIATGNAPGALRIANGIALSSLVQLGSNALISSNFGTVTLNGNLDVGGFTASFGNGNNAGTFNLNGVVTGTAGGLTANNGSGSANVINLNNAGNTYVGTTAVSTGGTVGLGGNAVLGGSTLAINGGTIRSTDATARTIANTITVAGDGIFGAAATQTGTLAFTYNTAPVALGNTTRTFTTNVNTSFTGGFSGAGGLTKAGAAALTLNGASAYAGGTNVNAGTLFVNNATGSGTGTAFVTVTNAGSVLGGTGTVTMTGTNVLRLNTGTTLAPGAAATTGILSVGGAQTAQPTAVDGTSTVTLAAGSTFSIRINGGTAGAGGYDQLNVTGTIALGGGTFNLTLNGFTPGPGQKFVVINNDSSDTVFGTFANLADGSTVTAGGQPFTINYNAVGGSDNIANDVVLTYAVPEPGSWAMLAAGFGLLGYVQRRRRAGLQA